MLIRPGKHGDHIRVSALEIESRDYIHVNMDVGFLILVEIPSDRVNPRLLFHAYPAI